MPLSRRDMLTGAFALPFAVAAQQASAATHQITIKSFRFRPPILKVKVGDTIVFTNADGASHSATSQDGLFDTGILKSGARGAVRITTPGQHEYFCTFHRNMRGTIIAA